MSNMDSIRRTEKQSYYFLVVEILPNDVSLCKGPT